MNNIILLGFMGSGKTAVGRLLAAKSHKDFIDLDDWIEKEAEMTINEIFNKNGEAYFRELEKKIVEKASNILTDTVISTGGGVVLQERNIENLNQTGVLIWLKVSPEKVYERTRNTLHRPLLNCPDPLGRIKELLSSRTPYYIKAADYIIDTSNLTVEEVVAKIIEYLT